ncbi:hypothetical protein [Pseudomonas sp. RL_5y_Pfl2_73]|uniref:hypothetical protein n=1 Tax=Pseudomonas sp. RL_5y_Pfl2_73 TaxID=3088713 RepID=UPI0030D90D19
MSNGIIGTKIVTRTGSFEAKFIPFIYVIVEDRLAQEVIDLTLRHNSVNEPKSAIKYITSGVWANQASCMYGFYTYGNELTASYQIPFFSALAVTDGDVCEEELNKRLNQVIKGSLNEDQSAIKEKIRNHTTQFKLEHLRGPNEEPIKALPEYNHKLWFDEITEQMILDQHQKEVGSPDKLTRLLAQHEIGTLLEVIQYSRSILNGQDAIVENEKIDYHRYYDLLKAFVPQTHPDHAMNHIEYYILRAIRRYNPIKWERYTSPVRDRIMALAQENYDRFRNSSFDLR